MKLKNTTCYTKQIKTQVIKNNIKLYSDIEEFNHGGRGGGINN